MNRCGKNAALTRTDLLVTCGCIAIVLLIASIGHARTYGVRNRCTANLKILALGFNLWAQEHQNRFPMEVPIADSGTREYALAGDLLPNLLVASNELGKVGALEFLVCPKDKKRKAATSFSTLTINNVSYFLSADAARTNQNKIIAGDRNLMIANSDVKPGLLTVTDAALVSWAKGFHDHGGDIAMADGSAHEVTTKNLQDVLRWSGTNRLIVP